MKRIYSIAAGRNPFFNTLLCVILALSLTGTVHAAEKPFWSHYGKEYLYTNAIGGLTRVFIDNVHYYENNIIYVEEYDSSFTLQAKHDIPRELSLYGGFYAGAEYNYLIFGQTNKSEDNSAEVIRVVKYSKGWERLGQASVFGANTTEPFRAGSCRCVEAGGMLYVHTCHQMYKSNDGLNHQANMTFIVRTGDMAVTSVRAGVSYANTGYVSHSFNQYILADKEGNIVTLDLGDAYPRAITLSRYNGMAGSEKLSNAACAVVLKIDGKIGDNNTGVSIGGFAETDTGYVTAYNYKNGDGRSFYLAYTSKSDLSTKITQLSEPLHTIYAPLLVPMGTSGGYVLWRAPRGDGRTTYYAAYSADGTIGEIHATDAPLWTTDGSWSSLNAGFSMPVYYNGKIVWSLCMGEQVPMSFVEYNNKTLNFYLLDDAGTQTISVPAE